jgi:hypothetical protein
MRRGAWAFVIGLVGAASPLSAGLVRVDLDDIAPAQFEGGLLDRTGQFESMIPGQEIAAWITQFIPIESQKLLTLTQCRGGDMLADFAAPDANIAVISATSPRQNAYYDGYHTTAALELKPGSGRTAQTVHDLATAAKKPNETPATAGALAPGSFSLENTSVSGDVRSRHVLIYAGLPEAKDNADRDAIIGNFQGQFNTSVATIGSGGTGGWSLAATAENLRTAIKQVGQTMAASADPSKEQFILFAGDHGTARLIEELPDPVTVTPGNGIKGANFPSFTDAQIESSELGAPGDTAGGFSVFIPFEDGFTHAIPDPFNYESFFKPGDWSLTLHQAGEEAVLEQLDLFEEIPYEIGDPASGGNTIGDVEGEGVYLFFPIDFATFTAEDFNTTLDIDIVNSTSGASLGSYDIASFQQESGALARLPEPAAPLFLMLSLALTLRRSRAL